MVRQCFLAATAAVVLAALPSLLRAQSNDNGAPLGSKDNPIKVTAVGVPVTNSKAKGNGAKRGSKSNPITGQTHPRVTN
jgi:hypothetical protein